MNQLQHQYSYTPEDLLLAYIFGASVLPDSQQPENACMMNFITFDDAFLSRNNYDTAMVKINMGRFAPTKKFLNDVADTLAADMTDYVKSGGSVKKMTAKLVYDDSSS